MNRWARHFGIGCLSAIIALSAFSGVGNAYLPNYEKERMEFERAFDGMRNTEHSQDIYEVMAMVQKMAEEQRAEARAIRQAEIEAQVRALQNAADEMRNKANAQFQGAVVSGGIQVIFPSK